MRKQKLSVVGLAVLCAVASPVFADWTVGSVPADGVYKFTFGVENVAEGEGFAVPASAVCDVRGTGYYTGNDATFTYGFLGTTDTSYTDDVPASPSCAEPTAIDGFWVVQGQKIFLHDATDKNGVACVKGPMASEYLPAGASSYEGRYPIRFSMRGEERAYYAVTCTVANASSTANADVTIFSERQHIIVHHLSLSPGETKTFAWSVELAPNVYKTQGTYYDNAVNVCVVGENAALASLTIVKQPQTSGTVRGEAVANMNVGKTMWLCTDSTGTDQKNATPYFSLQNYSGVGSGLSRWAPANLSIRNQGEGGLATNANAHRQSCLLKPGDYLYVEYGHNEKNTDDYTNNLETYLKDVNDAGANLIIVSPVERRSSWNGDSNTWNRSLAGYATAGEAWVEEKIAQGARNVAFVDLNKTYNDWMNQELVRIHEVNPDVSLNAAISFYYRSAKGANVDNTHINNAGTDQAAYWFWYNALARVAAGENAEEGSATKVQSDVLKGITEGYQGKIGIDANATADNLPWSVTDDIIAAGAAPNSFWDTPVSTGYDYVNDAVVADVQATANNDGTVTISGVTMRILNPGNYYKAVIEVFDSTGASQGKYYSYYNYDVGGTGATSGALINPNEAGFLTSDKDKAAVTAADVETVTVPAGGKAEVWMAVADAGTWQVGENAPCSPKYPVEWWSDVIFDNDCSSLDGWTVNSQAVNDKSVAEDGGIYFTSAGADAGNTKKNYGFYHAFDNSEEMAAGRYRISFKVKADSGHVSYQLFNSLGTTTNPFNGTATTFLDINGTTLTAYKGTMPLFTKDDDGEGNIVEQNLVNKLRWIDVDIILDRDNDRAWISAGGSDYVEYSNSAFLPGSYNGTTWKYFGITCESMMASYGYIDDVKIVKLASVAYPSVTAAAAPSDASMGSVTINGYETNELAIYAGNDFMIRATSADPDFYVFENWTDGEGNVVSTDANLFIDNASENISLTANFREYGVQEQRTLAWDFSAYQGDFEVALSAAATITDNGMTFSLQPGDKITAAGIYWQNAATGAVIKKEDVLSDSDDHYIVYTPKTSGTLSMKFSVDNYASNRKPIMCIKAASSADECNNSNGDATLTVNAKDTEYTLSANLTAGTTYYIWAYSYNWSAGGFQHNYTIPSITYTYAPVYYTAAAAVAEGQENLGTATVSASEVISGKSVTFTAKPVSGVYKFVGWTDANDEIVSTSATYTTVVTADLELTANFATLGEGENYVAAMNFERFAGNNAVTTSGSSLVTQYGDFEIYTSDSSYGNDSITENGIYWHVPANDIYSNKYNADQPCDYVHYIKLTAQYSGTITMVFHVDKMVSKRTLSMNVTSGELSSATKNNTLHSVDATAANTDQTFTCEVTAGTTYWFWCASQNWSGAKDPTACTISSLTYTHVSDPVTLTLATESGTVAINGVVGAGEYTVQKGEYVWISAAPSEGHVFEKWTNADGETVSESAGFWCCAEDGLCFTANWQEVDTHSFVWNWNVAEGEWNNPANWYYANSTIQAETYPSDAESDYATFTTATTVTLTGDAAVKEAWFNADVTLTGGTLTTTLAATYDNQGKVTLSNAGFANPKNLAALISCPIVMAADTVNWFNKVADGDWKEFMVVSGNISGSGRYDVNIAKVQGNAIHFTGNNNNFYGDVYTSGGKSNRSVIMWGDDSVGTNTFLHIGHSYGNYNSDSYRMGAHVKFGGVEGSWWDRYDGAQLTIGYLNRDSTINISNALGDRANSVKKVGTANLTLGTTKIKDLTIESGSVTMPIGIAPQTLTMAEGASIMIGGDAAWVVGTQTNLFSYGSFVDHGAGELARQVTVTGLADGLEAEISIDGTTVTATIVASAPTTPTTDDEGAVIVKDAETGAYTITTEAETLAITVPEGVTVGEVVVSPATMTVTGVPEGAKISVMLEGEKYEIVKLVDSAVELDGTKSAVVEGEAIPVTPALTESGDEEAAPLAVDAASVAVGVKAIPGLTYRLVRGSSPTEIATPTAEEKATGRRVSLEDKQPPHGSAFYRIYVGLK